MTDRPLIEPGSRTFADLVAGLNAGQHLAIDAVVAFVDGELGPGPAERAAAHVARCPACAGEVSAQRLARRVVRAAGGPDVPAGLLAALRAIPDTAACRPAPSGGPPPSDGPPSAAAPPAGPRSAPFGAVSFGATAPWDPVALVRRARRTGAGVVVSGVLGVLVLAAPGDAPARPAPQTAAPRPVAVPEAGRAAADARPVDTTLRLDPALLRRPAAR